MAIYSVCHTKHGGKGARMYVETYSYVSVHVNVEVWVLLNIYYVSFFYNPHLANDY